MNADEAQARMQEIQRIMERATLFTLLPGTAAVVGGLLVLAGCAVSYAMFRSLDFAAILHLSFASQAAILRDVVCHRRDRRVAGGDSHARAADGSNSRLPTVRCGWPRSRSRPAWSWPWC